VEQPRPHHNLTLGILTLAGAAFALQQTLVFPALSTFQRELHTSTAWATWVVTAFLVSGAVLTPILGRLGDQYGKARLLNVSLALFVVGCLGASLAWNISSLIGFRALAGAGAALFPLSFAIIRDEFPPEKVKVGIGLLSAVFGVGGGFGIVLSGVIVDHLSWRVLFLVGAVPVFITILLVRRFVPESPVRERSRVDVPGALLLSGALVALMIALTEGESWGWSSPRIAGLGVASAALFLAWGRFELQSRSPMVDMRMLAHRPVLLTNVTTIIAGFALFGCFVLVPTFVETPPSAGYGFGASASVGGLYLLPSSIALLFAGPIAGLVGRRVGSKWPLVAGMFLISLAATMLATTHDKPWQIAVATAALGAGVGLGFAAMAALVAENVRSTETGVATGVNTVVRMIGAVVGGQIAAALLTAETIGDSSVPAESAFTTAFTLSAVAALFAGFVALSIEPRPVARRLEALEVAD
jgi:EmrB/QacA subfamily drug resistance transporter